MNGEDAVKGLLMGMVGGGRNPAVEWNGGRKLIQYGGEMYVVLGTAFNGDVDHIPAGVFVMNRRDYVNKKPVNLQFIPGEFLVEVYPSMGVKDSHSTLLQSGCAADESLDEAVVDMAIQVSKQKHPKSYGMHSAFETFRNNGRYKYPDLSPQAEFYLNIDVNRSALRALADELQNGSDMEDADNAAKKAAKKAMARRKSLYPELFKKDEDGDDE